MALCSAPSVPFLPACLRATHATRLPACIASRRLVDRSVPPPILFSLLPPALLPISFLRPCFYRRACPRCLSPALLQLVKQRSFEILEPYMQQLSNLRDFSKELGDIL